MKANSSGKWRKTDAASTPVLGILVVSLFFGISFATVLSVTNSKVADVSRHDGHDLQNVALTALDLIVRSPGIAAAGGLAWESAPDTVRQVGLALPGRPNVLDYNKVLALRGGGLTASTNGFLDYPEARAALSLNDVNFHLRSYPALPSVKDPAWAAYRGVRVAYVGHFDVENNARPTAAVSVLTQTTGLGYSEAQVTVTYQDGPATNLFHVNLDLDTTSGHLVKNAYTKLVSPGQADTITVRFYDAAWPKGTRDYALRVSVTDAATATQLYDRSDHTIRLTDPPSGDAPFQLLMEPSKSYFWGNPGPKLVIDKSKADGSRYRTEVQAFLTVRDPLGALVLDNVVVNIPRNTDTSRDVDVSGRPHGTYTATLTAGSQTITNRFTVLASKLDNSAYLASTDNMKERGYIGALVAEFHNVTAYSGASPADVYRDHKDDLGPLGDLLVDTVANPYDILVVGSRVTHNELQGHFPSRVLTFVENGGLLIALGSDEKNQQWMKSIFGAGVATATGGISTPDPTAPILHAPEELAYRSYHDGDRVYKIDGNDRDKFTHVLVKESSGSSEKDTLAMSNPGAFGKGTVIVTSYIPNEIFGSPSPEGDEEAKKLLHNLFAQAFRMLFIDYGPLIPAEAVVASATRLALVALPNVPDSNVEVRVVLYVFK